MSPNQTDDKRRSRAEQQHAIYYTEKFASECADDLDIDEARLDAIRYEYDYERGCDA